MIGEHKTRDMLEDSGNKKEKIIIKTIDKSIEIK